MIAAGLLLFSIGAADLSRQFLGRGSRAGRIAASIAAVIVVAAAGSAIAPWPLVLIAGVIAVAWLALMPSTRDAAIAGFWPAVGIAIAVVVLVVSAPATAAGWTSAPWATAPVFGKIVLLVGVGCFLLESANIVVRVALQSEQSDAPTTSRPTPPPLPRSVAARLLTRLRRPAPPEPAVPTKQLRGGRLIGPLERLFVVGLIFTSAVALLAAFIAAKGIVRFPEIQKDNAGGTQAEYFLVGSMASWALALASAGLLWAVGVTPSGFGIS